MYNKNMDPKLPLKSDSSDSKTTLITMVILYVVSIIVVGFLSYFAGSFFATRVSESTSVDQSVQSFNQLPVRINNPFVLNTRIYYSFKGQIENYDQKNKTFILKGPVPVLKLKVDKSTKILGGTSSDATSSSRILKQGDIVKLNAKYTPPTKAWEVMQIRVLE